MKLFLYICILIASFSKVSSQIEIRGQVLNENGEALPYSNIVVHSSDSTTVDGYVTEEDGSFILKLPENTYTLSFSYVGYKEFQQRGTIFRKP